MKKFANFISERFGYKKEEEVIEMVLKAPVTIVDVEKSFGYKNIKPGDVVLHKNGDVYKVVKFGKMQVYDRWLNAVIYVSLENEDPDLTFIRSWDDFAGSFKKVIFIEDTSILLKRIADEKTI